MIVVVVVQALLLAASGFPALTLANAYRDVVPAGAASLVVIALAAALVAAGAQRAPRRQTQDELSPDFVETR